MLLIATHDNDKVVVDDREISRQGVSYTVDTLNSFRQEIGENVSLFFILGIDSFCTLNEWARWQELADIAHLIVLARPGYLPQMPAEIREWQRNKLIANVGCLRGKPGGGVCHVELIQVGISSTEIRDMIGSGIRPTGKMPESVIDYAFEHELYRS